MAPVTSTVTALIARKLPDEDWLQCKKGEGAVSECNLFTLASLIQSLHSLGLWPLPSSNTWTHSASRLRDRLGNLTIVRPRSHRKVRRGYGPCPSSVASGGEIYWLSDITLDLITNEQLEHLGRQAATMGLAANS